ncbi:hypothetical protein BaRGS_00028385 [Batillaria attramentaria]|uniref:Uncharacterized protein n=1 Tax=Batillaria attramentaria TaxID=370345 RepID=A0ABD0JZV9_9CAEN
MPVATPSKPNPRSHSGCSGPINSPTRFSRELRPERPRFDLPVLPVDNHYSRWRRALSCLCGRTDQQRQLKTRRQFSLAGNAALGNVVGSMQGMMACLGLHHYDLVSLCRINVIVICFWISAKLKHVGSSGHNLLIYKHHSNSNWRSTQL